MRLITPHAVCVCVGGGVRVSCLWGGGCYKVCVCVCVCLCAAQGTSNHASAKKTTRSSALFLSLFLSMIRCGQKLSGQSEACLSKQPSTLCCSEFVPLVWVCVCVCFLCICLYVHTCAYVYACVCVSVPVHVCVHAHLCVYMLALRVCDRHLLQYDVTQPPVDILLCVGGAQVPCLWQPADFFLLCRAKTASRTAFWWCSFCSCLLLHHRMKDVYGSSAALEEFFLFHCFPAFFFFNFFVMVPIVCVQVCTCVCVHSVCISVSCVYMCVCVSDLHGRMLGPDRPCLGGGWGRSQLSPPIRVLHYGKPLITLIVTPPPNICHASILAV